MPKWVPDKYADAFQLAREDYIAGQPNWPIEVLVSLIKWGLKNLRYHIEENKESKVTWEEPLTELHYNVKWDWDSPQDGNVVYGKLIAGEFTRENMARTDSAKNALAAALTAWFNCTALGFLTNGARIHVKNGAQTPYVPIAFDGFLKTIENPDLRRLVFEEIIRPFSIGAERVIIQNGVLQQKPKVPQEIAAALAAMEQKINIPGVSISKKINGRHIWAGLVFEIQPLVTDSDAKRAYFPITVGIAFERRRVGNNVESSTPERWPRADRAAFWDSFFAAVDELTKSLIPKGEIRPSIILKINEGLEIERVLAGPDEVEAAKRLIMEADLSGSDSALKMPQFALQELLDQIEKTKSAHKKGLALEKLMAHLFGSIPGLIMKSRRVKTETEEIDLVIANGSDDPKLRREEALILVECKNWSSKCGKNEFVEFRSKLENRKGRCSLGFLVSWGGFADTVTKEMLRGSREKLLVIPIDGDEIKAAIRGDGFWALVESAWDKATMM